MKLFCAFQYYLEQLGLEIQDGCLMIDTSGETVYSEVNPDCMRIKTNDLAREKYDKDIWR
jgi:hypothetical protein